jgi:hypothetical protein
MLPEQAFQRPTRSAHHGDYRAPNELLPALLVADRHPEIQVFEIDFVDAGGPQKRLVSSHDYDERAIARGAELEQWIDELVVKRGRLLWLDCKQNLDLYFAWQYTKFHPRRLMRRLEAARARLAEQGADLTRFVWIGCQDCGLRAQLLAENERLPEGKRWRFILDMPTVESYVWQRIVPHCWRWRVYQQAYDAFRETDYQAYDVISLDRTFFDGPSELKRFVRSLKLRPSVLVVLNSFPLRQAPVELEDHAIVMQYDYTEQQQ